MEHFKTRKIQRGRSQLDQYLLLFYLDFCKRFSLLLIFDTNLKELRFSQNLVYEFDKELFFSKDQLRFQVHPIEYNKRLRNLYQF